MKRFGVFALVVAVVMAFGLVLVGCGNGGESVGGDSAVSAAVAQTGQGTPPASDSSPNSANRGDADSEAQSGKPVGNGAVSGESSPIPETAQPSGVAPSDDSPSESAPPNGAQADSGAAIAPQESEPPVSAAPPVEASPPPPPEPFRQAVPSNGYYFVFNGANIVIDEDIAQVISEIGEAQRVYETESCAFKGLDKKFYFPGFIIDTYPDGSVDRIISITLTDAGAKTPEGVRLGMEYDDVINAYGDGFEQLLDMYSYVKGIVRLSFLFEDGVLEDITYYNIPATNQL